MKENFLFHIDHTCYCLFFKLRNKIPKNWCTRTGISYSVFNSLCPHFAKTAVYSLRVSSCLQRFPFRVKTSVVSLLTLLEHILCKLGVKVW